MFEQRLKETNPTVRSITYDLRDLHSFVDTLHEVCALVYAPLFLHKLVLTFHRQLQPGDPVVRAPRQGVGQGAPLPAPQARRRCRCLLGDIARRVKVGKKGKNSLKGDEWALVCSMFCDNST